MDVFKTAVYTTVTFTLLSASFSQDRFPNNGTLLLGFTGYYKRWAPPFQLFKLGSAFLIALDKINTNETILPNYTVNYVLGDDDCARKKALGNFVTLAKDKGIIACIGPACSGSASIAGYLASYWNIPMIGYGGTDALLSDKLVNVLSKSFEHFLLKRFYRKILTHQRPLLLN